MRLQPVELLGEQFQQQALGLSTCNAEFACDWPLQATRRHRKRNRKNSNRPLQFVRLLAALVAFVVSLVERLQLNDTKIGEQLQANGRQLVSLRLEPPLYAQLVNLDCAQLWAGLLELVGVVAKRLLGPPPPLAAASDADWRPSLKQFALLVGLLLLLQQVLFAGEQAALLHGK